MISNQSDIAQWYVMRDLRRPNARILAYRQLEGLGVEVYTPLYRRLTANHKWIEKPMIHGLLFVHGHRANLDPIVSRIPTLQYRFLPHVRQEPMIVPDADMERFIHAVRSSSAPRYYLPDEITPSMLGNRISIVGGPLDGYEGHLLKIRGSRIKRLLVRLPGFLYAGVEVNPEYIQLLEK